MAGGFSSKVFETMEQYIVIQNIFPPTETNIFVKAAKIFEN